MEYEQVLQNTTWSVLLDICDYSQGRWATSDLGLKLRGVVSNFYTQTSVLYTNV